MGPSHQRRAAAANSTVAHPPTALPLRASWNPPDCPRCAGQHFGSAASHFLTPDAIKTKRNNLCQFLTRPLTSGRERASSYKNLGVNLERDTLPGHPIGERCLSALPRVSGPLTRIGENTFSRLPISALFGNRKHVWQDVYRSKK